MKYSHSCFGSLLTIDISSQEEIKDIIAECFELADIFEIKYSRFIAGNFLSKLNENKISKIDREFYSILKLCEKVSKKSEWYFDITILPILENLWYGIHSGKILEAMWYKSILLSSERVELKDNVSIDIWAVWKWYMVDKIYNKLSQRLESFTVDFGWDIRVKGNKKVFLEDPWDNSKSIWYICIENTSIASSAWNKRNFWESHHLINGKTKESQNDKIAVYVIHKLSSFSDIFSTALFVSPIDISLKILATTKWLEGLVIWSDGRIHKSKWFHCVLNTTKIWV